MRSIGNHVSCFEAETLYNLQWDSRSAVSSRCSCRVMFYTSTQFRFKRSKPHEMPQYCMFAYHTLPVVRCFSAPFMADRTLGRTRRHYNKFAKHAFTLSFNNEQPFFFFLLRWPGHRWRILLVFDGNPDNNFPALPEIQKYSSLTYCRFAGKKIGRGIRTRNLVSWCFLFCLGVFTALKWWRKSMGNDDDGGLLVVSRWIEYWRLCRSCLCWELA